MIFHTVVILLEDRDEHAWAGIFGRITILSPGGDVIGSKDKSFGIKLVSLSVRKSKTDGKTSLWDQQF